MGGILAFSFAIPLYATILAFAGSPKAEMCLSHCSLEKRPDGTVEPLCYCLEKKFPKDGDFFSLRNRAPAKYAVELRSRLRGATEEERDLVATNACQLAARSNRPANEFLYLAKLAQRPLCECVRNRVHFPLKQDCESTKAGVLVCRFELVLRKSHRVGPVRRPTLHDYQACLGARLSYRRPASCSRSVCSVKPVSCENGKELVNVADAESCCPVFECRGGEG